MRYLFFQMSPDTMKFLKHNKTSLHNFLSAKIDEARAERRGYEFIRNKADWDEQNSIWMPFGATYCTKWKLCTHTPPEMMSQQRWSAELCWANLEPSWVPSPPHPPTHTHTHTHTQTPSQYPGVQGETVWSSDWVDVCVIICINVCGDCIYSAYPHESTNVILWICECVSAHYIWTKVTLQHFSGSVCWYIGFAKKSPVIKSNSAALP